MMESDGITALRRFGLGPRPGEWRRIAGDPRGAVLAQVGRSAAVGGRDSAVLLRELAAAQAEVQAAKRSGSEMENGAIKLARSTFQAEVDALFDHRQTADDGYTERLVGFWAEHFTVATRSAPTRLLAGSFVREAIRPHVYGRFGDMLVAVAAHPAMIHYLDNIRSTGPNSRRGQAREKGFNENLAREILELHTVGADAGYTQADVTAFALILTGWSVVAGARDDGGQFHFDAAAHEPGTFTVMGRSYPESGVAQGLAVLSDLAGHPATARRIAGRLARHFVGDAADPSIAARLEAIYRDTGGDLAAVSRGLVEDDRAWAAAPAKVLPPIDMIVAFGRATETPFPAGQVLRYARSLGQVPWGASSPEGFPDGDESWASPDGLLTRLDLAVEVAARHPGLDTVDVPELADALYGPALGEPTLTTLRRAESREQALALLLMAPELQRR